MKPVLNRGDVARSIAGHDAGGLFVVLDVIDADYVWIADGETRPIEKPKKKKRKHLIPVPAYHMEIDPEARLWNSDLKKFLKACDHNLA